MDKTNIEFTNEKEEELQNVTGGDMSKIRKEGEQADDSEDLDNKARLGKTILIVPTDEP